MRTAWIAVVSPVPHAVKGYVPAALVVLKRGASAEADALKTWCLDNGPKYAHPRFVQIIDEKDLPLNGAGQDRPHPSQGAPSGYDFRPSRNP